MSIYLVMLHSLEDSIPNVACFRKEDAEEYIGKHKHLLTDGDRFNITTVSLYGEQNG